MTATGCVVDDAGMSLAPNRMHVSKRSVPTTVARVFNRCRDARFAQYGTGWKPVLRKCDLKLDIKIPLTVSAHPAHPRRDGNIRRRAPDTAAGRTRRIRRLCC